MHVKTFRFPEFSNTRHCRRYRSSYMKDLQRGVWVRRHIFFRFICFQTQIRVLSEGLNFCPTPREINRFEIIKDLTEFGRRMKCRAYFGLDGESDRQSDKRTHVKEKSKWSPENVDPALDLFLKAFEEVLSIKNEGSNYSNLSGEERKALKELQRYCV